MNLRLKLILPFALLLAIVYACSSLYLIPSYNELAKSKQIEQESTYIDLLSTALLPDLLESDLANVYNTLDTVLSERKHWYSLSLFNVDNIRIYPLSDRYIPKDAVLESLTREVIFNGKLYASIKLQLDIQQLIQEEIDYITQIQHAVMLILFLTFLAMSVFLDTFIRKPMVKLADFADQIANGNYQSEPVIHTTDEVGHLAQSLEMMQNKIHERDQEMSHYSDIQDTIRFVQNKFISEQEASHVFLELQRKILELTDCDEGLIGELMLDDMKQPYIAPLSINNKIHLYSGNTVIKISDGDCPRLGNVNTLLGKVMTTGKPLINNGPNISSDQLGFRLEKGKEANNFLGLPLYTGYQFVGILCLVNNKGEFAKSIYNELEVLLQTLAQLIVAYRERKTLIDNEARLRMVVDNAVEGIISTDETGTITSFNSAAERIFGYSQNQMIGTAVISLIPEHNHTGHIEAVKFLLNDEFNVRQVNNELETDGLHRNGKLIPLELSISKVVTQQGLQYTGIVRDITERKQHEAELSRAYSELQMAHEQLEEQNRRDSLTGLANRRHLDETLNLEWKRAERQPENPLSLILCDIDYFKNYNDTYGHLEGDECLRQVSLAIKNSFTRKVDLPARYGGEEFMIILPNTSTDSATRQAERMRQNIWALAIEHKSSQVAARISISAGVYTIHSTEGISLKSSIGFADESLYEAKAAGRNKVIHYESLHSKHSVNTLPVK
jgi:diguanylate cyclase (GGDEF)-like protein/PAS domain S-box-containing protein